MSAGIKQVCASCPHKVNISTPLPLRVLGCEVRSVREKVDVGSGQFRGGKFTAQIVPGIILRLGDDEDFIPLIFKLNTGRQKNTAELFGHLIDLQYVPKPCIVESLLRSKLSDREIVKLLIHCEAVTESKSFYAYSCCGGVAKKDGEDARVKGCMIGCHVHEAFSNSYCINPSEPQYLLNNTCNLLLTVPASLLVA